MQYLRTLCPYVNHEGSIAVRNRVMKYIPQIEAVVRMQRPLFCLSAVLGIFSLSITSASAFSPLVPADIIVRIARENLRIPIESFLVDINESGDTLSKDNNWRGEFERATAAQ